MPGGALPNPAQIAGSRMQYAEAVLNGVNAPSSPGNTTALIAWMKAEGGSAKFNPMNTTQPAPGATDYNSAHVKDYTSWNQGVGATVDTLTNGSYAGILAALRSDAGSQAVARAVGSSPWGTNGTLMAQIANGWGNGKGALQIQMLGYAGGQVAGVAGANIGPDLGSVAGHVKDAILSPLSWGEAIAKFLGTLLDRNTWVRVLEILGGLALGLGGLFLLGRILIAEQAGGLVGSALRSARS